MSEQGYGLAAAVSEEYDDGALGFQEKNDGASVAYVQGTDSLDLPSAYIDSDVPDVDDVWAETIDHEEEDKAFKATQPPGGYYDVSKFEGVRTSKEAKYTIKTEEGYKTITAPRASIRYSGRGYREVDGHMWSTRISFTISPVRAFKRDFNTNEVVSPEVFDSAHKFYHRARVAYEQVLGEKASNPGAVDEFVRSNPFKVRVMQSPGGDGLIVLDIQAVKV